MNDPVSQNLLLAIVHGLRNACRRTIQTEKCTAVTGFLYCNIDGKAQHQFVINEFISRENYEGHSSCLKDFDWNKRISSQTNERSYKRNNINNSPVIHNNQGKNVRGGQTKIRCGRSATKMRQETIHKCLSGPVSHCHFTGNRNKRSNQTFTLEDYQLHSCTMTPDFALTRNFSTATISIASQKRLPVQQGAIESHSKLNSSYNIPGTASPSIRSLCEGYKSKIIVNASPDVSCLNNNLSDQLSRESTLSQVKINSNVAEVKKINQKANLCSKGNNTFKKTSKTEKPVSKDQKRVESPKINVKQVVKLCNSSSCGDSDVSIASIRPRYLVQHNNELLLPCPNLSSKYKHQAASKNNNRTQNMQLSSQNCEDSASNTSNISTLLSSIIGALSYSSSTNGHDKSNNTCVVSLGLNVDKLKGSDETEASKSDSLGSVSSLETDSLKSCLDRSAKINRSKIITNKMSHGKGMGSAEIEESSSVDKQSKLFPLDMVKQFM